MMSFSFAHRVKYVFLEASMNHEYFFIDSIKDTGGVQKDDSV